MSGQFSEAIAYNAINIALNGDYKKIKLSRKDSWLKSWDGIKKDFPRINPEEEFKKLQAAGIRLILDNDSEFPSLFKEIAWSPFAIYLKGKLKTGKAVAIVGTRRITPQGKAAAKQIAEKLASGGLIIASGLALGADEAAHQGALAAGGQTVAVLPSGLGKIYPRQNATLADKIAERGALISEFPLDYHPYKQSFIQRNRLVSALSAAIIIIEAPEKSGALSTARFALEQDREVMVLPGPSNHANYKGSHRLIREGARLVTSAEDILEDLGLETKEVGGQLSLPETNEEEQLVLRSIEAIGWPASIDKIAEATKIQVQKINQIIAFLTIKGILK